MTGSYDYRLVTLSVVIAVCAAYAALDLAGRTTAARGRVRLVWLAGGAAAMGLGIWSMHYIGMLAFLLPVPVFYDLPTVLVSLFAAIFASGVALFVVSRHRMDWSHALAGSIIMGSGIATMHYTGMAAAKFTPSIMAPNLSHAVQVSPLGIAGISSVTLLVLGLVSISSLVDRRFSAQTTALEESERLHRELEKVVYELKKSEDRLRVLIETIPALAWTSLADGSNDFVNRRWLEYTGISLEQMQSAETTTPFHPEDIDERKRAEEALRKANADLAHITRVMTMGEFAASIAHEVSQPLSAVVTNAEACLRWLAGSAPNIEKACEAVGRVVRDGKRAGEVIAQIRALYRKIGIKRQRLDMNEAIEEVLALAQGEVRTKRVALRTDLATRLPPVLGDRVQLQQVVLNLIMNGIEAMSSVQDRPRELVIKTQEGEDDQVVVTVQDSGTGLDPKIREQIFDAFYTTKGEGTGMGLSISRSLVQDHGGRLWASTNQGPGATFQFTLSKHHETGM